jgi:hypothetical protein
LEKHCNPPAERVICHIHKGLEHGEKKGGGDKSQKSKKKLGNIKLDKTEAKKCS